MIKSKIEIEVSDYKFPIIVKKIGNGLFEVEEENKDNYKETLKHISKLTAKEEILLVDYIYQNCIVDIPSVMENLDHNGLYIGKDDWEKGKKIFNYIKNRPNEVRHLLCLLTEKGLLRKNIKDIISRDSVCKVQMIEIAKILNEELKELL